MINVEPAVPLTVNDHVIPVQDETDAELAARFERDVVPLLDTLFGGAMRMTLQRADAEDLVQETLVQAYKGFRTFQQGTHLKAWLFRIQANTHISRYRKQLRQPDEVPTETMDDWRLVADAERDEVFPREAFRTLGRAGLLGLPYPEELGGGGVPYEVYLQVLEEIGTVWASVGVGTSVHALSCFALATRGTPEQQQRWLPDFLAGDLLGAYCLSEPHAGSDPAAMRTKAVRDGSGPDAGWGLTGAKALACGFGTSCALRDDGTASCWGSNAPKAPRNATPFPLACTTRALSEAKNALAPPHRVSTTTSWDAAR